MKALCFRRAAGALRRAARHRSGNGASLGILEATYIFDGLAAKVRPYGGVPRDGSGSLVRVKRPVIDLLLHRQGQIFEQRKDILRWAKLKIAPETRSRASRKPRYSLSSRRWGDKRRPRRGAGPHRTRGGGLDDLSGFDILGNRGVRNLDGCHNL
jgi:hypothetical protein